MGPTSIPFLAALEITQGAYLFYKEPYRPPFFPGQDLPIRPPPDGQLHAGIACPLPPNTDTLIVRYDNETVETSLPVSALPNPIPLGFKPNPEAIPLCSKWLSTNATVITSDECQRKCEDTAKTLCANVAQNWVYKAWETPSQDLDWRVIVPNGMIDCVASYFIVNFPTCTGPCKVAVYPDIPTRQDLVEVPCFIELGQCHNRNDPRLTDDTDSTTQAPTTSEEPETTDTTEPQTTSAGEKPPTWQLGILGGAMVSGAGSAAICCYCSSDAATRGLQDFSAQIGDGIDDAERMLRRDKCAEQLTRTEEEVLRDELSLRASRSYR